MENLCKERREEHRTPNIFRRSIEIPTVELSHIMSVILCIIEEDIDDAYSEKNYSIKRHKD